MLCGSCREILQSQDQFCQNCGFKTKPFNITLFSKFTLVTAVFYTLIGCIFILSNSRGPVISQAILIVFIAIITLYSELSINNRYLKIVIRVIFFIPLLYIIYVLLLGLFLGIPLPGLISYLVSFNFNLYSLI